MPSCNVYKKHVRNDMPVMVTPGAFGQHWWTTLERGDKERLRLGHNATLQQASRQTAVHCQCSGDSSMYLTSAWIIQMSTMAFIVSHTLQSGHHEL